jgi:hypothetical protein
MAKKRSRKPEFLNFVWCSVFGFSRVAVRGELPAASVADCEVKEKSLRIMAAPCHLFSIHQEYIPNLG